MYAIKQFYLKLFNAKTTMKDKTMMCDETKNECCNHADPPWEGPQVIPAQIRRVDNLIFRKINQFARENDVEQPCAPPERIYFNASIVPPKSREENCEKYTKYFHPFHRFFHTPRQLPMQSVSGKKRKCRNRNASCTNDLVKTFCATTTEKNKTYLWPKRQ